MNSCNNTKNTGYNGSIIVLVVYILLVIIIGKNNII